MKRTRKFLYVLGIGIASLLVVPPASADQPASPAKPAQAEVMAKKLSATATVVKVDPQKRHLTLKNEKGEEFTIQVSDEVKRLDELQPGDRIKLDYYESVGISLKKGEAGAQPRAGETTMMERSGGKLPGGKVAHMITASVEVTNVDRANHKVTVKRPDGDVDTIDVTDPAMQAELGKLAIGDHIQATYSEAMAITVTREAKPTK